MIAKLASGGSQKSSASSTATSATMSASQSKRKRSKLLDLLLNTNWSKQSQQPSNLMKLNKVLLCCDPNFLDEKTGESPLSMAISSQQINSPLSSSSNHLSSLSTATTLGCIQSASLFNLQSQHTSSSHNQLTLRQTSATDLSQSKAPLVERITLLLIKNGAKVDFRNNDSRTPLHVAAMKSNFWASKTLLDLGASTDYRDINGLTPLYYSILHRAELKVTQLLLNYNCNRNPSTVSGSAPGALARTLAHAMDGNNGDSQNKSIGITDQQGWQEVHHACKLGLDAHLDKLLYYGCDINAKISGSGNTPLHVAAINDQLNCAKVLLLRGADKTITNNSHQTAHQVAVISNNMDLAEFISEHDESKVVPFAERPAPVVATPSILASSHYASNRHSFALPKAHHYQSTVGINHRFSVSSAQHLVNSQSTNNLGTGQNNEQAANIIVTSSQQEHQSKLQQQFISATLSRATGMIESQRRLNPLVLDVSGSQNQDIASANSSAPTSTSGASSGTSCGQANMNQPNALLTINANQPPQMNNISPSLSQRSSATTNTTATSSSGVCCDGDAHNSSEELAHSQSRHSNITIISINNPSTIRASTSQAKIDTERASGNAPTAIIANGIYGGAGTNCSNNRNSLVNGGPLALQPTPALNSFVPPTDVPARPLAGHFIGAAATAQQQQQQRNSEAANDCAKGGGVMNERGKQATFSCDGHGACDEGEDDDDLRSSASSNGLQSLMSDERPLFAGSIVEATSEYQSGDPSHLQLHRGDLVEVLEYPRDLVGQGGQLPSLANKPMLFGCRQSDGKQGLFPSFCVRRTKQRQSGLRQRIALNDIANEVAAAQNQQQQKTYGNHSQVGIVRKNMPDSQSMIALDNEKQSSYSARDSPSRPLVHEQALMTTFREFQVNLAKVNEGFGFVLRGARINPATVASTNATNGQMTSRVAIDERLMAANHLASLQYLDDIEQGSVADQAGLRRGDFLVAVNQQDVRLCSHEQVVHMIRQSGNQVSLTIATPTVAANQDNCGTQLGNGRTLTRKKPEPPKRDPTTTLTRNRTQRVKSMSNQQMPNDTLSENHNQFDANKPLPNAPNTTLNGCTSPNNSYDVSSQSSFSHLAPSNSNRSSSGGLQDAQSIASMSTLDMTCNIAADDRVQTPIQSSSSTTTLTTVATTKPKAPAKPSHLKAAAVVNVSPTNYQSAIVTTTRRSQQSSPMQQPSPPPPIGSEDLRKMSIPTNISDASMIQSKSQPPPPPPPPPPMPNFSSNSAQRLSQRRTSMPLNQTPEVNNPDRTLRRRESLATTPAANISSVAAACAAAANNRLWRQQQKQQQQQQNETSKKNDDQISKAVSTIEKENAKPMKIEMTKKSLEKAKTEDALLRPASPPSEPPPPPPPLPSTDVESDKLQSNRHIMARKQAMLSATLGRNFSAQIIQQPITNQASQSQTLRAKPKRPSILNFAEENSTPPAIPHQKTPAHENKQRQAVASNQQVAAKNCHHHSQRQRTQTNNEFDGMIRDDHGEIRRRATRQQVYLAQQKQQQLQQQLQLQQQHQRILHQRQHEIQQQQHYEQHQRHRCTEHDFLTHDEYDASTMSNNHTHQQLHNLYQGRDRSEDVAALKRTASQSRTSGSHHNACRDHEQSDYQLVMAGHQSSHHHRQPQAHSHHHDRYNGHEASTTNVVSIQQQHTNDHGAHHHYHHHHHDQQQHHHPILIDQSQHGQDYHRHQPIATRHVPNGPMQNGYMFETAHSHPHPHHSHHHHHHQQQPQQQQKIYQMEHQHQMNNHYMPVVYSDNSYAAFGD